MTPERLAAVFHVVASMVQFGVGDRVIELIRHRAWVAGHDVTEEEIREVMAMTVQEVSDKLKTI